MEYQITYSGNPGTAEKTADYFFEKLPKDTLVIDAAEDSGVYAKTVIAVFDMGRNFDTVPYRILDLIEKTGGRELVLFAVIPVEGNENIKNRIERAILPFIPDSCGYCGIHLIRGEANRKLVKGIESILRADPDNDEAAAWLEECNKSRGRPERDDLEKAFGFLEKCIGENGY